MKVVKYFRAVLDGFIWSGATYLSANEQYKLALFFVVMSEIVTIKIDEEILFLKGFLFASLGKDLASLQCLKAAVDFVEISESLNDDEKNYLKNYASNIISKLRIECGDISFNKNYNVNNVASHTRTLFPVAELSRPK